MLLVILSPLSEVVFISLYYDSGVEMRSLKPGKFMKLEEVYLRLKQSTRISDLCS